MIGGIKIERAQKTKFRKNSEQQEQQNFSKKKHNKDKAIYRMIREDDEYEYTPGNTTANRRA